MIDAHIVQRAASRLSFLDERRRPIPIDIGPAAAPGTGRTSIIRSAHPARGDRLPGCFGLAVEQRRQLDGQVLPGPARGLQHGFGVPVSTRHRLLAIDMLARLQSSHGDRAMQVVMQADAHRIDFVMGQQLVEVCRPKRDGVVAGDLLRPARVAAGDGDHFHVGEGTVGLEVVFPDLTNPDDADPEGRSVHVRRRLTLSHLSEPGCVSQAGPGTRMPRSQDWQGRGYPVGTVSRAVRGEDLVTNYQ